MREQSDCIVLDFQGTKPTGGVAQLGEHLPCKQGVSGSNPLISTSKLEMGRGQLRSGERT